MINDLNVSLQAFFDAELTKRFPGTTISFAAPGTDFRSQGQKPALNIFLYEIRENRTLRECEPVIDRSDPAKPIRIPPSPRVDCSYLITAWPRSNLDPAKHATDEGTLLGVAMTLLLANPSLPAEVLKGQLRNQPALPLAALSPGSLSSLSEFWRTLGGEPKAALHLTVTIAVPVAEQTKPDVVKAINLGLTDVAPEDIAALAQMEAQTATAAALATAIIAQYRTQDPSAMTVEQHRHCEIADRILAAVETLRLIREKRQQQLTEAMQIQLDKVEQATILDGGAMTGQLTTARNMVEAAIQRAMQGK